jgi:hypothetical protein
LERVNQPTAADKKNLSFTQLCECHGTQDLQKSAEIHVWRHVVTAVGGHPARLHGLSPGHGHFRNGPFYARRIAPMASQRQLVQSCHRTRGGSAGT